MAIQPEKVNFNNIDEVKSGDGILPEQINAPLKSSAWAQNQIDMFRKELDMATPEGLDKLKRYKHTLSWADGTYNYRLILITKTQAEIQPYGTSYPNRLVISIDNIEAVKEMYVVNQYRMCFPQIISPNGNQITGVVGFDNDGAVKRIVFPDMFNANYVDTVTEN